MNQENRTLDVYSPFYNNLLDLFKLFLLIKNAFNLKNFSWNANLKSDINTALDNCERIIPLIRQTPLYYIDDIEINKNIINWITELRKLLDFKNDVFFLEI